MVDKGRGLAQSLRMALGAAIRAMRGRDPQSVLANIAGVKQATISRWEKGISTPTVDQLVALEDHYGRPRGSLLRESGLIDAVDTAEKAIAADGRLTPEWRAVLLASYAQGVGLSASEASKAAAKRTTRRK